MANVQTGAGSFSNLIDRINDATIDLAHAQGAIRGATANIIGMETVAGTAAARTSLKSAAGAVGTIGAVGNAVGLGDLLDMGRLDELEKALKGLADRVDPGSILSGDGKLAKLSEKLPAKEAVLVAGEVAALRTNISLVRDFAVNALGHYAETIGDGSLPGDKLRPDVLGSFDDALASLKDIETAKKALEELGSEWTWVALDGRMTLRQPGS